MSCQVSRSPSCAHSCCALVFFAAVVNKWQRHIDTIHACVGNHPLAVKALSTTVAEQTRANITFMHIA
jgi:hypothetical protein